MSEDQRGKIVKITFEYEKKIQSLEGEAAQKWLMLVNGMCTQLGIRNQNPFNNKDNHFEWTDETGKEIYTEKDLEKAYIDGTRANRNGYMGVYEKALSFIAWLQLYKISKKNKLCGQTQ